MQVWSGGSLQTITSANQSGLLSAVFSEGFTNFSNVQVQPPHAFDTWISAFEETIAEGLRGTGDDPDGDSFTNSAEFLFGTRPDQSNGSLTETVISPGGLTMIWNERAGLVYTLQESETLADEPWPASGITPQDSPDQNGVPAGYTRRQATLTIDGGARFIRVKGGE